MRDFPVGLPVEIVDIDANREECLLGELRTESGSRIAMDEGSLKLEPEFFTVTEHHLQTDTGGQGSGDGDRDDADPRPTSHLVDER